MLFALSNCSKEENKPKNIDHLIGSYDVFEKCDHTLDWSYIIEIVESDSSGADVIIKNFGDYSRDVYAIVNDDVILYDYAEPEFTISGNGDIKGSALTLYYTNTEGGFILQCTANATKK